VRLEAVDTGPGSLARTEVRLDGGAWRTYRRPAPQALFDGSAQSFRRWRHVGPGAFLLQRNGTMRTSGGLGMLWYPARDFGSVELHLRWRVVPGPGNQGNSGVVIRFPRPVAAVVDPSDARPCHAGVGIGSQALVAPEYAAINCGNEIQVYDASPGDPQRTGSVYDFSFLHDPQQRPVRPGTWTDYVVRVVGGEEYAVTVVRDGHVINEWVNTAGQLGWRSGCYCGLPAELPGDPPSDLRRFARGYVGLQNHGASDVVEYGRVTVTDLSGESGAFVVSRPGRHVVEYRSVDAAGNAEPVQQVRFSIGGTPAAPPGAGHACSVDASGQDTPQTCSYVASGDGRYDAQTTSVWSIRVTRGRGPHASTRLVAGHASAPSLPVSGRFHAEPGELVTVTLGPDLVSSRDDNVAMSGGSGSVTAGDG
jgi:hypothetical protein